jgi:hypothetical protein
MKIAFIYALVNPRSPRKYKYIGYTKRSLRIRLNCHVASAKYSDGKTNPVEKWVFKLLEQGLRPEIVLLEECKRKNWKTRERYNISLYRNLGHPLLNVHGGGNGGRGKNPKLICECGARRKKFKNGSRRCVKCQREYMKKYRRSPKFRAKNAVYQESYKKSVKGTATIKANANKPKSRARKRAWYYKNHKRRLAKQRAYRRKNRETIRKKERDWYYKNRKAIRAAQLEYVRKNRKDINAARRLGLKLSEYRKQKGD